MSPIDVRPVLPGSGAVIIEAPTTPAVEAREGLVDALLADVAGGLAVLRDRHPEISFDEVWERARNIVQGLVVNYQIEPLPEGRS